MTKTYSFYTKKNNSTNNSSIFLNNKPTDYSEILDNIIAADIIKKNNYLFDDNYDPIIDALNKKTYSSTISLTDSNLKFDDIYIKAVKFLSNYKKYKKINLPFIIGKMYKLSDGTPIIFYDDEIQIGFDTYKYSNFNDYSFLNNLKDSTKKTIINIYTFGTGNININLL